MGLSLKSVFFLGLCLLLVIWPLSLAKQAIFTTAGGNIVNNVTSKQGNGFQQKLAAAVGLNGTIAEYAGLQWSKKFGKLGSQEMQEGSGQQDGEVDSTAQSEERRELNHQQKEVGIETLIGGVKSQRDNIKEKKNVTEMAKQGQQDASGAGESTATSRADPSKIVDQIYIVNIPRCTTRWSWVQNVSHQMGLEVLRWPATAFQDIDFENPPLPLEVDWTTQANNKLKAGELGCIWSHVRLWRHALENNYQRIMVFEDDVFLNATALPLLEGFFRDADLGAQQRNQSWHYLYLRRWPLQHIADEPVWLENQTSGRVLTIAHPSWGTAAYALSRAGIEWLVNAVTVYQRPLDVQLAKFQADYATTKFIALSACDRDHFQVLCPENIQVIPDSMQGECGGSMSQSGGSLDGPPVVQRLLRFVRRLQGLDTGPETASWLTHKRT